MVCSYIIERQCLICADISLNTCLCRSCLPVSSLSVLSSLLSRLSEQLIKLPAVSSFESWKLSSCRCVAGSSGAGQASPMESFLWGLWMTSEVCSRSSHPWSELTAYNSIPSFLTLNVIYELSCLNDTDTESDSSSWLQEPRNISPLFCDLWLSSLQARIVKLPWVLANFLMPYKSYPINICISLVALE